MVINYKKKVVLFDLKKITRFSGIFTIISFVVIVGLTLIFKVDKTPSFHIQEAIKEFFLFFILYGILIVVHELLHAIGFIVAGGASVKDIKFGFIPKFMMFYCHCKKPLRARGYMIALLLPVTITGFIPAFFVIFSQNLFWATMVSLAIASGAGDLTMAWELRKLQKNTLVQDHESLPAYYILYPEDDLPDNFEEDNTSYDIDNVQQQFEKIDKLDPQKERKKKIVANIGYLVIVIIMAAAGFFIGKTFGNFMK